MRGPGSIAGAVALLLLVGIQPGCVPEDQRTGTVTEETWTEVRQAYDPAVQAQIDSANAAYSAGDYPTALLHYNRALEVDDGVAAAWFGVYMAHQAMGNMAEAEAALERAQDLRPGASLIREDPPAGESR